MTAERELPSRRVGEFVMAELRKLDHVAYVRFASVYRSFEDVRRFPRGTRPARSAICRAKAQLPLLDGEPREGPAALSATRRRSHADSRRAPVHRHRPRDDGARAAPGRARRLHDQAQPDGRLRDRAGRRRRRRRLAPAHGRAARRSVRVARGRRTRARRDRLRHARTLRAHRQHRPVRRCADRRRRRARGGGDARSVPAGRRRAASNACAPPASRSTSG